MAMFLIIFQLPTSMVSLFTEQLTVTQLVKKFLAFTDPEGSSLRSQMPTHH
jgi:hypothetical protein